ncbi:MAG: DUF5011 domain-containing protein [Faecalicoccus sp.]|nr:DUF5011 domain-containing protein [Faecalicoccus sp.]
MKNNTSYLFTFVNICGDEASASGKTTLEGYDGRIVLKQSSITLKKGETFNAMDYLDSCTNAWYEDISDQMNISDDVDTSKAGTYTVKYSIYDVEMPLTVKVTD